MTALRLRPLVLACLLAFCLSSPGGVWAMQEDKDCEKPKVTFQADGKTPTADPLPEIAYYWGDHMEWPVLDRTAYERLTVAAARLPALVIRGRHYIADSLSRAESPPDTTSDTDNYVPTPEERVLWLADDHEYDEFLGAVDMAEENLFAIHEILRVDHSWPGAAATCALVTKNARLAQRRLQESAKRMAALSRETDEGCLKARDALLALTPTVLTFMDEAIRPVEARACWKWAEMTFPYSAFGKQMREGISQLEALNVALETLDAPQNAGNAWPLARQEAVILARTARTSLERTGRFLEVGSASSTLFVNVVEYRLAAVMDERLCTTLKQLEDTARRAAKLSLTVQGELKEIVLQLEKCCLQDAKAIQPVAK